MFFNRGSAADYDAWEKLGNPGWSWEDLLPYFKKVTYIGLWFTAAMTADCSSFRARLSTPLLRRSQTNIRGSSLKTLALMVRTDPSTPASRISSIQLFVRELCVPWTSIRCANRLHVFRELFPRLE